VPPARYKNRFPASPASPAGGAPSDRRAASTLTITLRQLRSNLVEVCPSRGYDFIGLRAVEANSHEAMQVHREWARHWRVR
jgi:hypothetical protein